MCSGSRFIHLKTQRRPNVRNEPRVAAVARSHGRVGFISMLDRRLFGFPNSLSRPLSLGRLWRHVLKRGVASERPVRVDRLPCTTTVLVHRR